MDARHFDRLARALSEAGTRRGVLSLLATLPVLGGLFALLAPDEIDAKGRRKRRKKKHKHGKGRHKKKHHKKKCKADSKAKTCAGGTCGPVTNNCKKTVDCGSCDCPEPCDACFICQSGPNTPGACVPDPEQDGEACDDGDRCTTGNTCSGGVCGGGSPVVCPATECQIPGVCDPGSGSCTPPGVKPPGTLCAAQPCGACNGAGVCVANAACGSGDVCCSGSCEDCCDSGDCSGSTPVCVGNTCSPCGDDPQGCPGSTCCDAATDECVDPCPASEPICGSDNICAPCESHAACGTNALCVAGQCQACGVVDGQNLATAVGAAQDGDTLYVCAGTYAGNFQVTKNITLIGAGQGPDGTVIQGGANVLWIAAGTAGQPVTLRGLRLQNGFRGIFIQSGSHLTMTDCTVRGNSSGSDGAGIRNNGGTLLMTGCTVENNNTDLSGNTDGGGLYNVGGPATLTDCLVQGNSAREGGGIFNVHAGIVTLSGTRVTNNTARFGGGSGIFNFDNSGSTVTLQDGSTVCANNPTADQCHNVTDPDGGCQVTCPAP